MVDLPAPKKNHPDQRERGRRQRWSHNKACHRAGARLPDGPHSATILPAGMAKRKLRRTILEKRQRANGVKPRAHVTAPDSIIHHGAIHSDLLWARGIGKADVVEFNVATDCGQLGAALRKGAVRGGERRPLSVATQKEPSLIPQTDLDGNQALVLDVLKNADAGIDAANHLRIRKQARP